MFQLRPVKRAQAPSKTDEDLPLLPRSIGLDPKRGVEDHLAFADVRVVHFADTEGDKRIARLQIFKIGIAAEEVEHDANLPFPLEDWELAVFLVALELS